MASSDPQGHPQDPAQRSSQSPPRLPSRLSAQQHPDPAEKIQPLPPIVPKRDEDPDLPTTAETPSAEEEQAQAGALEYSESIDVGDPEEDQGVVDGHLDNVSRLYMSRFTQVTKNFDGLSEDANAEGTFDSIADTCLDLLSHADLPDLIVGGYHFMLAHGRQEYMYHAQQAHATYKKMVERAPDNPQCRKNLAWARDLLEEAQESSGHGK